MTASDLCCITGEKHLSFVFHHTAGGFLSKRTYQSWGPSRLWIVRGYLSRYHLQTVTSNRTLPLLLTDMTDFSSTSQTLPTDPATPTNNSLDQALAMQAGSLSTKATCHVVTFMNHSLWPQDTRQLAQRAEALWWIDDKNANKDATRTAAIFLAHTRTRMVFHQTYQQARKTFKSISEMAVDLKKKHWTNGQVCSRTDSPKASRNMLLTLRWLGCHSIKTQARQYGKGFP